jgi:ElaB/YqjD/DUF883 family membrane-anchored ribosome-binding protein
MNTGTDVFLGRFQAISSKARTAAKTAEQFVLANPWQAAGAAALAGFAATLVASRRMSRRGPGKVDSTSEVAGG